MRPKPAHLSAAYAAQFQDAAVVAAYPNRPPYPAEVFDVLRGLLTAPDAPILDLGCGTGDLARPLAERAARVDALDISANMLARAHTLPGGDRATLHWMLGGAEDAPVSPPYGLITAGESLHWMAWEIVLPRCQTLLAPSGVLAIVEREELPRPWFAALVGLIQRYSTNSDFRPYNLIHELATRGLFERGGEHVTVPVPFTQSIASYIESIHSRNGFSRDRMVPDSADAFDAAARALLEDAFPSGQVELQVGARITWGTPNSG